MHSLKTYLKCHVESSEQLKRDFENYVVNTCVITVQTYHHNLKINFFDVPWIYHLKNLCRTDVEILGKDENHISIIFVRPPMFIDLKICCIAMQQT